MSDSQNSNLSLFSIPFTFFFFNKPRTCIVYFSSVFSILCIMGLLDKQHMLVTFPFFWLAFSSIYKVYLYWKYFIKDSNESLNIKSIKISFPKKYFEKYFKCLFYILTIYFIILCSFPIYSSLLKHKEELHIIVSIGALIFLICAFISKKILENMLVLRITSEAIKNNVDLKDVGINNIYQDLREILTKKLIDTNYNKTFNN